MHARKANTWIDQPRDWQPNTEVGRTQDLMQGEGLRIWQAVMDNLRSARIEPTTTGRYDAPVAVRPRLGQGAFRILVTDTYQRRCAVTGERTQPVLQAAHIRPFSAGGLHDITNGLLLRSDLHALFDRGYVTVTPEYRLEVSRHIREELRTAATTMPSASIASACPVPRRRIRIRSGWLAQQPGL